MPNQTDINIEFGHIYVNETFDPDHEKSAKLAREQLDLHTKQGKKVTTTVLIDDYNPTESFLIEKDYLKSLKDLNMLPDYLAYESKLALWVEDLLEEMSGKLHKKYLHYVLKKGKAPCSLLVAVWHLVRLGALDMSHPNLLKKVASSEDKPFTAKKIITILPRRYQAVEESGKAIILSTKFSDYVARMETIFV